MLKDEARSRGRTKRNTEMGNVRMAVPHHIHPTIRPYLRTLTFFKQLAIKLCSRNFSFYLIFRSSTSRPCHLRGHILQVQIMPLISDLTLNASKFDPASNPEQSKQLNDHLVKLLAGGPKWFEVCLPIFNLSSASFNC